MVRYDLTLWTALLTIIISVKLLEGSRITLGPLGWFNPAVPPPKTGLCTTGVIKYGYECEEYEVTTQDGYILNMIRIPKGRGNASAGAGDGKQKQPVLIQHGVLVDGMTWLLNQPEQNLPMILADEGFDVWISNGRGTQYSRKHKFLNPELPAFWNWSWDEIVTYDLPALVGHVYNQTGQKLHYIGHSLGTLTAVAAFTEGRLVDKLKSAALLSPVFYLTHMTTLLGDFSSRAYMGEMGRMIGAAEFNPKGRPVQAYLKLLCGAAGTVCHDWLTLLTVVRDGKVAKYNYGIPSLNLKHYGKLTPPLYDLSRIPKDFPIFFSYGSADALADVGDVKLLLESFKSHNQDKLSVQLVTKYAHADFIFGFNAKDIVYNKVLSFFRSHA